MSSRISGLSPQTLQCGLLFRRVTLRKVVSEPSKRSNRPDSTPGNPIIIFMASNACKTPIVPGTTKANNYSYSTLTEIFLKVK